MSSSQRSLHNISGINGVSAGASTATLEEEGIRGTALVTVNLNDNREITVQIPAYPNRATKKQTQKPFILKYKLECSKRRRKGTDTSELSWTCPSVLTIFRLPIPQSMKSSLDDRTPVSGPLLLSDFTDRSIQHRHRLLYKNHLPHNR